IEDAYKWLFHATLGGEHAITIEDGPRKWLDDEWQTLGSPRKTEPLLTSLRPDGKIVRLNLRPYKALGGEKDLLLKAFIMSAKEFKPNKTIFEKTWQMLGAKLKHGRIGFLNETDWLRLDKITKRQG